MVVVCANNNGAINIAFYVLLKSNLNTVEDVSQRSACYIKNSDFFADFTGKGSPIWSSISKEFHEMQEGLVFKVDHIESSFFGLTLGLRRLKFVTLCLR